MADYVLDGVKKIYVHESPIEKAADKKCPLDFIVPRFEDFDSLYTLQSKALKELGLSAELNKKRFTVSDTRASSRVMNSWSKHKILPEGVRHRNNWKKFSAIELLWIDAAHKMQEFGLSLKQVAVARSWVMQWDKENKNYPWFEYYFALALMSDADPYIVVLPTGMAEVATSAEIEVVKATNKKLPHMLLISLKALLMSGFNLEVPKPAPLRVTTGREQQVLQQMRDTTNKEIRVRTHDGKISEVETTQIFPESRRVKIAELKKDIQEGGAYAEMTVRFAEGKQQSLSLRKIKRFKSEAIGQQAGAIIK
jgi:hypothetical protein